MLDAQEGQRNRSEETSSWFNPTSYAPALTLSVQRVTDRCLSLWPNPSSRTEAIKQLAVASQKNPHAMCGKTSLRLEVFNRFEEAMALHTKTVARYSVQVNTRDNVHDSPAQACYVKPMENGWFDRLKEAIESDPRSPRAISLAAKCGPNYVQQMLKDGKEPGSDRLARLLDVLGTSGAMYVLAGIKMSDDDRELLKAITPLSPELRASALRFLTELAASGNGSMQFSADSDQVASKSKPS